MPKAGTTFSESWHKIADLRVSLRPTVKVHRQLFRGQRWYILHDPFNNAFFRLRPEAYDFISRLQPNRTVEEVWEECLQRFPETVPGQEDVLQLLSQLYYANILYSDMPADSTKLFERYRERRQREVKSWLMNIMFVQIPLFDPEYLLKKFQAVIKLIFGPIGALIWLLVIGAAAKCVADRFDLVSVMAQGVLAPDNLLLLYAALVVVKTLHEFGHAMSCKRFGGEVHVMGVMLLVFTPLPYMDATSSWSFRSRWPRILVSSAGMIMELFVAGVAVFIWSYTGAGTIHSLAYNIMFIASVSTILFNANPLLHFDGYYILSDLLDIPNLAPRALEQLRHLAEHYLFGYKDSFSPAQSKTEAVWLSVYGVASGTFHAFVFTHIIMFVADKFLLAGMIISVVCLIAWVIVPLYPRAEYLATSPRLERTRSRAICVCVGAVAAVILFFGVLPFPNRFRAPGILEAVNYIRVINAADGYMKELYVPSGREVKEGTPLLRLSNRELELETKKAEAQKEEILAMHKLAMSRQTADLKTLNQQLMVIENKLKDFEKQKGDLIVKARQKGIWAAPSVKELVGTWVAKGTVLGEIVDQGKFRFSSVVSQDDAAHLFVDKITKAEVRLFGQAEKNIKVNDYTIIPFQSEKLPSAALGWYAGGEVAVSPTDKSGLKASEPFFLIHAMVDFTKGAIFHHGKSGKLRFTMHPEPLLWQWLRKFRQLIQKRYQI